ncbi:hypothetical protein [Polaribacter septentrionalilitoris]|uniref:hypothetical protein n=1 Tax=Polaribacter septentrionalilitoris TaxID=2494657 RepID=UPI0013581168|nr:hypothetical protein [Polaribacter septentrionalilitoris]
MLSSQLLQHQIFSFKNVLILVVFSALNWFFEILKWNNLVNTIKNISFWEASIQCFSSLTASLITPNRIGEYGAKALYFEKPLRKKIVGLNFIGNFYQLIATLFFGSIGFIYLASTHQINFDFDSAFGVIFVLILLFGFFVLLIKSFQIGKNYVQKVKKFISKIPFSINLKTTVYSFLRYLIFSHQFYFLVFLFNLQIEYIDAISAITSVYLIASIVPMLSFFDVVLKGSISVWIFTFFQIDPISILTIVSVMWMLNFAIPAIIGSYFVITFTPNFQK